MKTVSQMSGCDGCPLRKLNPNNTFVEPLIGAGLEVAIGDAPDKTAQAMGHPMVGPTLSAMFRKANIEKDDVTLLNVIQCRPPGDIFPTDKKAQAHMTSSEGQLAVATCVKNHVIPMLKSRPWTRVILLGDQPLAWVAAKWASADKWRGSVLAVPAIDPDRPLAISTLSPVQVQARQKFFPVVVNDLRKPMSWPEEHYNLFPSVSDVRNFTAKRFAFDIETSYQVDEYGKREIYMVALSDQSGRALVVPFTAPYIPELQRIFREARTVVGHNCIQFDIPQLAFYDIDVNPNASVLDTMLLQHLRFPDLPHDLEFVASQFLTKPAWKHEKATKELYAARDVDATWQIHTFLVDEVQSAGMLALYHNVQVPLAKICRMMTETGIRIDSSRLAEVQKRIEGEIEELEGRLPEVLRSHFITVNKLDPAPEGYVDPITKRPRKKIKRVAQEKVTPWRLDRVKKNLLYVEWGLPPQLSPKTGKLTADKTALDKLHRRLMSPTGELYNPERAGIVKILKEINRKDHFLASFVKEERKGTDRIRPEFNVHGTSSGRLSSSGGEAGNFQNQPEAARYMYVPSYDDWEIAECDYSQVENRLTALLADDTLRLKRYDDPKHSDYKLLASRAFGIPYDEVEKDNDREAPYGKSKAIVLGCFPGDHEVLTKTGWVRFDQYNFETPIATWDINTTSIAFVQPTAHVNKQWKGNLIASTGRAADFAATPDHAFPVRNGSNKRVRMPLEDLTSQRLISGGVLTGTKKADMRLLAAVQADSSVYAKGQVTFNLKKQRKIDRLHVLAKGREYRATKYANGYTRFYFPAKSLEDICDYFLPNTTPQVSPKLFDLPQLLELDAESRATFLDELLFWDGVRSEGVEGKQNAYLTTDRHNAEIVQTLAHVTGRQALLRTFPKHSSSKGQKPMFKVSFNQRQFIRFASLETRKVPFDGRVYCVTVPSSYFLVRHNQRILVTGNTNYGLGALKTANMYDMELLEVKNLMVAWKKEIAFTVDWQRRITAIAKKQGWLTTLFGRKRWFYTDSYFTQALSFLPQSTAADIIYRAMIGLLYDRIGMTLEQAQRVTPICIPLPHPARIMLQVHDALVVEYPKHMREEVLGIMKTVMEQKWPELKDYNIPVGIAIGPSWGEVEPWKK